MAAILQTLPHAPEPSHPRASPSRPSTTCQQPRALRHRPSPHRTPIHRFRVSLGAPAGRWRSPSSVLRRLRLFSPETSLHTRTAANRHHQSGSRRTPPAVTTSCRGNSSRPRRLPPPESHRAHPAHPRIQTPRADRLRLGHVHGPLQRWALDPRSADGSA